VTSTDWGWPWHNADRAAAFGIQSGTGTLDAFGIRLLALAEHQERETMV
jgi:hypothetical protein